MAADLSTLPRFVVGPADCVIDGAKRKMLRVLCKRCGGGFLVPPRRWKAEPFTTRPCPLCFKVSST